MLQLIIDVSYEPNGLTDKELRDILWTLARSAARGGRLTCGTKAEVVGFNYKVMKQLGGSGC